jgi:plastocyanin
MKNLKYITLFFLTILIGCSDDRDTDFVNSATAPSDLSVLFTITQDNSVNVTMRPNGNGMTRYDIDFGDLTAEKAELAPGETVTHQYLEGVYDVTVTAYGINGQSTVLHQELTVTFRLPENLAIIATADAGNPYLFNVTATADYETHFEVTFGDNPDAIPVAFNEGQTLTHTYAAIGTYTITVKAFSGGAAIATATTDVTVFDPLLMPVDFESATLNYGFTNFGNAFSSVADNPSATGINTSAKVGHLFKSAGSEVWAGSFLELSEPIDFSSLHQISVKTFCPVSGITVKLKLENLANSNINIERDVTNTVANGWENLTFDFSGIDNANAYQRVVIFFDFNNAGTGADYYFDDIQLSSSAPDLTLIDFQETPAFGFTDFGNATSTIIDNPQSNGINTSAKVAMQHKANGAEVWAGSFVELAAPIDFSQHTKVKIKVWSPVAGAVIKFKLENLATSTLNQEWDATTTVANAWEELTYDVSNANNANNYQRVVVFCNFGVSGNNADYYFDDIKLSN